MENIKYVLLDLDGTLIDSSPGITNCVKYALEVLGKPIPTMEVLMKFIGPPLVDGFMEYIGLDRALAIKAVELYRERYRDIGVFECDLYDGAENLLKELGKAGKTIILATCKPKTFSDRILEHFGLMKYFKRTVGPELSGRLNYKHEVIEEIIKLENISDKSEMVMIGDRHHDIDGAKYHSIKTIGVTYGFAEDGELEAAGADYIATDTNEILKILL